MKNTALRTTSYVATLLLTATILIGVDAPSKLQLLVAAVPPTEADVAYGKHPKQVLHFWKAKSDKPAPLFFYSWWRMEWG